MMRGGSEHERSEMHFRVKITTFRAPALDPYFTNAALATKKETPTSPNAAPATKNDTATSPSATPAAKISDANVTKQKRLA